MIKYISTRGGGSPQTFEQVLLQGLAPDGGLYVPEKFPQVDVKVLNGKSYNDIAESVMWPFVEGSIAREDFRQMIADAYASFRHKDITPLHKLSDHLYVLEQFHGPTLAFKDVALQLLGRLFEHVLSKSKEHVTIVGATSGDTGSAAIEGCRRSKHVDIFILHPHGRVSDVQRRQMTTVNAPNVHNIAVEGTFDDCQNLVKAMFNDTQFRAEMNLSAVNSINWARIMAQIVYYFVAAVTLGASKKPVSFVVPTGNFGNVLAGYYAQRMGLPIQTLMISTNRNDILTRFFETGEMKAKDVMPTMSPSMDIQISSNFERYLFELLGRDSKKLSLLMQKFKNTGHFSVDKNLLARAQEDFTAARAREDETLATIREVYEEFGYVLDPHTAVGMNGAKALTMKREGPVVALATAHPGKFPDAVEKAINTRPALPDFLADLHKRKEYCTVLKNDLKTIQDFIRADK